MDLSIKKPRKELDMAIPLDIPQDLSMKKRTTDHEQNEADKSKLCPQRNVIGISEFDFYAYLAASTIKESLTKNPYSPSPLQESSTKHIRVPISAPEVAAKHTSAQPVQPISLKESPAKRAHESSPVKESATKCARTSSPLKESSVKPKHPSISVKDILSQKAAKCTTKDKTYKILQVPRTPSNSSIQQQVASKLSKPKEVQRNDKLTKLSGKLPNKGLSAERKSNPSPPCPEIVSARRRQRKQAHPRRVVKQEVDCSGEDSDSNTSFTEIYRTIFSHDPEEDVSLTPLSFNTQLFSYKPANTHDTVSEFDDSSFQTEANKLSLPTVLDDAYDTNEDSGFGLDVSENSSDHGQTQSAKSKSAKKGGGGGSTSVMLLKREHRRQQRLFGKEYTTPSGKTYPERKVREKDCSKCRYSCSQSISREQQQAIFHHFWGLNSYVKRLYYYCQSITEKPAKTMTHTRECSREYTFLVGTERIRVCKGFYLATLDVSDKAVRIAMEKRKKGVSLNDKRGIHPPHNKTKPENKDRIRTHIEDFLLAHICSNGSQDGERGGVGPDVNVTHMHQEYMLECQEESKEYVSEDVYRQTFNTEYNLSCPKVA